MHFKLTDSKEYIDILVENAILNRDVTNQVGGQNCDTAFVASRTLKWSW